jgi:ATP-dependent Clp protease ATP-binding subunit ClpC
MQNSNILKKVITKAQKTAITLNRPSVCLDILLSELLLANSKMVNLMLQASNVAAEEIFVITSINIAKKRISKKPSGKLDKDVRECLKYAEEVSLKRGSEVCDLDCVLFSLFAGDRKPKVVDYLEENEVNVDKIIGNMLSFIYDAPDFETELDKREKEWEDAQEEDLEDEKTSFDMYEPNSILDKFAINLNIQAAKGDFDALVDFDGRTMEIASTLCRKNKPNILLASKAGSGKTARVELLAKMIVEGNAPEAIEDKVIYSVNLASMVSGTTYRGEFEQKIEQFINEAIRHDNIILFFDEIHTLVGAGGTGRSGDLEASNILKPALARGDISCIGATTEEEYNLKIKKDAALDRRFTKIVVNAPSKEKMAGILPSIAKFYEDFHNIAFSEEFINNIIPYCEKFLSNKAYPDKAVDVLDECASKAKIRLTTYPPEIKMAEKELKKIADNVKNDGYKPDDIDPILEKLLEIRGMCDRWQKEYNERSKEVGLAELEEFFYKKRGFSFMENTDLKSRMNKNILGQKVIVDLFLNKIAEIKGGKVTGKRPNVFPFLGEKGSGKSLICETIADYAKENDFKVLEYNGIDFLNPLMITGYSEMENQSLCKKILLEGNPLVIIDDFDLISHESANLFLKIFKEGSVRSTTGMKVDFSNVDFIITSSGDFVSGLGFESNERKLVSKINKDIHSILKDEFHIKKLTEEEIKIKQEEFKIKKENSKEAASV